MTIEELKKRKKELGYTCAMLAEMSGVPLATVQKVFGGITRSPRLETVLALERVLAPVDQNDGTPSFYDAVVGERAASVLRETPGDYGSYVFGSGAFKTSGNSYPLLPGKRQGEYTAGDRKSLPGDRRTELIDGVLYDLASSRHVHQLLLGELYMQLRRCIEDHRKDCLVLLAPSDVWLDRTDRTVIQPDLYVLCDYAMLKKDGSTHGAPPFIAEILSPSTAVRDRSLKLYKYLTAGVLEYWIVDPDNRRVIVYLFGNDAGDALEPTVYTFDSPVPVGISEGLCAVDFSGFGTLLARLDL